MRGILLLGGLFGILTSAQLYNFGVDIQSLTRRQQDSSRVVVKGLPVPPNTTLPLRPEIREMMTDRYKWDLFMLALSMLQYTDQEDPRSWYQIAGIHGVPFEPWSGVKGIKEGNFSGYCLHSSVLFATWHRPYLALFEQELHEKSNVIASMFPNGTERQAYQDAARNFRMPYWDWSLEAPEGEEHLPGPFWNATVAQYGPRGVQLVRNPMYSYYFHPKNETAFIWTPLNAWDETKRSPNVSVSETHPPSDNSKVNKALLDTLPEIQQRLLNLFSNSKTFNDFGTKVWTETNDRSEAESIESIHDLIHIHGGLKGHMTFVPLSSYDPLFLLHHTMTDRLVAMWQILNPDAWMTPMAAGETSFTSMEGEMQNSTTPLTPFFASEDGTFWNSDMARTTEIFGYSYADTDSSGKKEDELRDELTRKITEWYGGKDWIAALEKQRTQGPPQKRHGKARGEYLGGIRPDVTENAPDPPASAVIKNGRYTDWVINVRVNIEALAGNFQVLFFIGPPPTDASQWLASRNRAAKVTFMGSRHKTGSGSMMAGSSPLTAALVKLVGAGEIPSLDPKHVVPFLEERLQFGVLGSQGTEVDTSELEGLHIVINSGEMELPEKGALPRHGHMACRMEICPGKSLSNSSWLRIPSVPPPWTLKGDVYAFAFRTSAASQDLPSFAYSPLEGESSYATSSKHVGGVSMLQIIRYRDSPVGPYDEMILAPGAFEYEREDENGRRVKRRNPKITRIYVSQRDTCYNGRKNWNVPKHLARFDWSDSDGSTTVKIYPYDSSSTTETPPLSKAKPFLQVTFEPLRFAPSFPFQTTWLKYVGIESTLVLPPLPAGSGTEDELPGTDRWCAVVPRQSSSRCSLGWFDLDQRRDGEAGGGEFDNFWPGWGRWHIGFKMHDAVTVFDHSETWDPPSTTQ